MSIHGILKNMPQYHFIGQEHKGIKYIYASNIQKDNILAIIKHTMPVEVEKCFQENKSKRDTLYIIIDKVIDKYYFVMSVAQSENLEYSHAEVLRICTQDLDTLINQYNKATHMQSFTSKVINAVKGGAVQLPLYIN